MACKFGAKLFTIKKSIAERNYCIPGHHLFGDFPRFSPSLKCRAPDIADGYLPDSAKCQEQQADAVGFNPFNIKYKKRCRVSELRLRVALKVRSCGWKASVSDCLYLLKGCSDDIFRRGAQVQRLLKLFFARLVFRLPKPHFQLVNLMLLHHLAPLNTFVVERIDRCDQIEQFMITKAFGQHPFWRRCRR